MSPKRSERRDRHILDRPGVTKVQDMDVVAHLTDALHTSFALRESRRVPWQADSRAQPLAVADARPGQGDLLSRPRDADFVKSVTIDVSGGNNYRDISIGAPLQSGRLDLAAGSEQLRAAGHQVYAPSLDGWGERKGQMRPGVAAETQADEVAQLMLSRT